MKEFGLLEDIGHGPFISNFWRQYSKELLKQKKYKGYNYVKEFLNQFKEPILQGCFQFVVKSNSND
ncbi:hypothetical protein ACI65C_000128, partial [Semiaphis heraclei]